MNVFARSSAALLAASVLAAAAHSQATEYDLFRTRIYFQNAATSESFDGVYLNANIGVTHLDDYGDGALTTPTVPPSTYAFDAPTPPTVAQPNSAYSYGSPYFQGPTANADFAAAYPHGTYGFDLEDGNLPADSGVINDPIDRWSADVPEVQEYDALQTATAGEAFTIHVDGFAGGPGTNDNIIFYELYDYTANSYVPSVSGNSFDGDPNTPDNGPFAFDIPANVLLAGHDYGLNTYYSSRVTTPGAGFGGVTSFLGYDNVTITGFSVAPVPEPASLAALGLGAAALLRRRRR